MCINKLLRRIDDFTQKIVYLLIVVKKSMGAIRQCQILASI